MSSKIRSTKNTVTHADTLTKNRLFPMYARKIATRNATIPAIGEPVEFIMAGKVITASVTYGT